MAQSSVIQAVVTPTRWFATLVAAILLGVFLLACVLLYVHADDAPEPLWTHWIKIFEALGPLVGLAVGWVFGKEVHRREADDAKQTAKEFAQGAHDGHALAEAVRAAAGRVAADEATADAVGTTARSQTERGDYVLDAANRLFPPQTR